MLKVHKHGHAASTCPQYAVTDLSDIQFCQSFVKDGSRLTLLTLIRSVLYRLVHFFLELFFNTDAKQKTIEIICYGSQIFL